MTDPERPSPESLLLRLQGEAQRANRAVLKVFFGFAPGVGKTYAMLESARALREQGIDVVVGCIETHGRYETGALVLGLEVLPRRDVEYRGTTLQEFDLERALTRKPKVMLVDELAHTNAPGGRHTFRWQDVLELLDAGIDVHTTLNVQHLESLNDVVAQVTGVRVRETVPDQVLDRADALELVDLPPEELQRRLREGKVYLGEQGARALEGFFKHGNLLALRELALRRTADRVDQDVQAWRRAHDISQTWAASERLAVCVGPAPASASLVRAARRLSGNAPWFALYVEASSAPPLSEADRNRLELHLKTAEALGGEVVRLSGPVVSQAILDWARKTDITRLLLGKPTHSRLRDRLRGSLLDEVVRGSGNIDVQVITGDASPRLPDEASPARARPAWGESALAAGLVALATGVAAALRSVFALEDTAMLYLVVILLSAVRGHRGPAVLASALSVAAFDFFFVPPFFTFSVSDGRHILTFAFMFAVGLVISGLTVRLKREQQSAREREQHTATLYALSRALGQASSRQAVFAVVAEQAHAAFGAPAGVYVPQPPAGLVLMAQQGALSDGAAEQAVARWVFEHGRPAGRGTDTLPGAAVVCHPLRMSTRAGDGDTAVIGERVLAVLALATTEVSQGRLVDRQFLEAFGRQSALALERARLDDEARAAALKVRTEELRSSLLSSVSHDLRTPLATITGSATTLRDDAQRLTLAQREGFIEAICEESERLERLVANLLDMTRLESGALQVKKEWVPLDEVVGSALNRLEGKLSARSITTALPPGLSLVPVDPVLFEQVLVNLLENAAKYTPAGSPIAVEARAVEESLQLDVLDRGPGIPSGDLERIFEKFHRGSHAGVGGVGLGLPICRGVLAAHGGTLTAFAREGGGAGFRVTIPLGAPPEEKAS